MSLSIILIVALAGSPLSLIKERSDKSTARDGVVYAVELRAPQSDPKSDASLSRSADGLDIDELVRETGRNSAPLRKQLSDYTYILKKIKRTLNEAGKLIKQDTQVFEAYPVSGEHVLIQLSENGVPSSRSHVAAERKRAGERLLQAEREKEPADESEPEDSYNYVKAGIHGRAQGRYVFLAIDPGTFLRSCEFSSPRFERIGDRDMIALSYRFRLGNKLPKRQGYVSKLTGFIWIDAVDKVLVRLEGWPAPEYTSVGKAQTVAEPRLVYQQERQPSGVWLPSLIRLNSAGDVTLFEGLTWDVVFEFSDYKRFSTGVEDVKIRPVKER